MTPVHLNVNIVTIVTLRITFNYFLERYELNFKTYTL